MVVLGLHGRFSSLFSQIIIFSKITLFFVVCQLLLRVFEVFRYAVLGRFGARFWGGLVRGFGVFWCAVLTFFIFFVSEPHDFAFAFDPEFIFSA